MKIWAPGALLLAAVCANAAQSEPPTANAAQSGALTLEKITADPDWIGPPVTDPYWSADGRAVYYSLKRKDSPLKDLHRIELAGGKDSILAPSDRANVDMPAVYDRSGARAAFVRNGDIFVRDRKSVV